MNAAAEYQETDRGANSSALLFEREIAPLVTTRASEGARDTGALATEIRRLTEATRAAAAVNSAAPRATTPNSTSNPDGGGIVDTAFRTAAMMTGVGPIVTGLMKLFGSSEPEALPPLEKFIAPSSISVDAALTANRDFGGVRYSQGGSPEVTGRQALQNSSPAIQVNIQAMDSQSFLDRQDDIARAVREAMLHSNSLNDVVMEL
jgi:hypothetical protein